MQAEHPTDLLGSAQSELAQTAPLCDTANYLLDATSCVDRLGVARVTHGAPIDGGTERVGRVLPHARCDTKAVHVGDKAPGVVVLAGTDGLPVGTGTFCRHRLGGTSKSQPLVEASFSQNGVMSDNHPPCPPLLHRLGARLLLAALPLAAMPLLAASAVGALPTAVAPSGADSALSQKPYPMIEAGMHTATIKRIGVDKAGRWAVTASEDKTARVWDLATGRLLTVLRVPVGTQDQGKLYAVALSPDGTLVALGGFTRTKGQPQDLFLFDRASGRLIQHLPGLPNVVFDLAFSGDGGLLAAALGKGVQVFSRRYDGRWELLAGDDSFNSASYSVAFAPDGRLLATVESDPSNRAPGQLRLYAPPSGHRLKLLKSRVASSRRDPLSACFSPDGHRIAVVFGDSTAVELLNSDSLALLDSVDIPGKVANGNLSTVAWSADGRSLFAAGSYKQADGSNPLVHWRAAHGALKAVHLGITAGVMDLQPLADGRLLFAGGDPAWGVLGADLQPQRLRNNQPLFFGPPALDHRNNPGGSIGEAGFDAFRLATDGSWIEFRAVSRSAGANRHLARFDLLKRRLFFPAIPAADGLAPRRSGLPIANWKNSTRPTFAGQPLPLEDREISRSLAVSADGQRFALGSEWAVRLFDQKGRSLWPNPISLPDVAWLVNLSADGRYVLAALADGTIRWYRNSDGSEALALFVHPDGRWVLWTPEGFYDASPDGQDLFGYHMNQGLEREGAFVSAAQLQQNFFRPDLIARRLSNGEAAIAAAVEQVGDVRKVLRMASLPPEIRLIGGPKRQPSGEAEISFELIDKGGGIGRVETRLNGAVIEGRANPPVVGTNRIRLSMPDGKLKVTLAAFSRSGVSSAPVVFELEGAPSSTSATLHLLAVGITNYRDSALRGLRFAANDARAFCDFLSTPGRSATAKVAPPVLLTDEEASGERIRQELATMAKRVKPGDLFVLYLAGHGVSSEQGEYVFLPQDLKYRNSDSLREGLGGEELRTLLANIPSTNTLVVLDTSSSGAFGFGSRSLGVKGAIDRFSRLSGRVVLAAASDRRMAMESSDIQGGIFTRALLNALAGGADINRDGVVRVREAADFVEREVQRITQKLFKYEQTPWHEMMGLNFPLTHTSGR